MSAYICSNKTISRVAILVTNVLNDKQDGIHSFIKLQEAFKNCFKDGTYDCQLVADTLYKLNVESVNARYQENTSTKNDDKVMTVIGDCELNVSSSVNELLQLWMSTRCFNYQSCEKDDDDIVLEATEELVDKLVDAISLDYPSVKCSDDIRRLPEYEDLEWD